MNFIGPIFSFLSNVAGGALKWMGLYGGNKPTEARVINDEQKKLDEFNKAQAAGNLDEVRKFLSDNPPPS